MRRLNRTAQQSFIGVSEPTINGNRNTNNNNRSARQMNFANGNWMTQNFGTKLNNYQYVNQPTPKRDYEQLVSNFLNLFKGTNESDMQKQFMFQLQKQLTDEKVIQEMNSIYEYIFFLPSQQLRNLIGKQWKMILFKSLIMKFGDLYNYYNNGPNIQKQIDYMTANVWGWGPFFVDIRKLQQYGKQKFANRIDEGNSKSYELPFYQLTIQVQKKSVIVKHKLQQISPLQFQTKTLRQMALNNLLAKAKNRIQRFQKLTQTMLLGQKDSLQVQKSNILDFN